MCSWNRLQIHSDLHQFYIPPLSPAQVLNAIKCACWEAPQRHPQYPLITANTFGEQKGQRPFYRSLEKQQHVSIQKCIIIFICLSVMAVSPPPVITVLFLISYTVQESKIHAKVGTFLMRFIAYFWERTFCHWYKLLGGGGVEQCKGSEERRKGMYCRKMRTRTETLTKTRMGLKVLGLLVLVVFGSTQWILHVNLFQISVNKHYSCCIIIHK